MGDIYLDDIPEGLLPVPGDQYPPETPILN